MDVVQRGFDCLDVAIKGNLSKPLFRKLEEAKFQAEADKEDIPLEHNGVRMHIAGHGVKGYAIVASTGPLGANWFIKRPNPKDKWGIRLSMRSLALATLGLGSARDQIHEFLDQLEVRISPQSISVGRADYAIDVSAPDFELNPDQFVMHSRSNRSDYYDKPVLRVSGASGRVTSVTVGKIRGGKSLLTTSGLRCSAKGKSCGGRFGTAIVKRITYLG